MNLHDREVTAWEFCQPVGGLNARDQRSGYWQMGLKDCRLTKSQRVRIRSKSRVGVTGGRVDGARGIVSDSRKITETDAGTRKDNRNRAEKRAIYRSAAYALRELAHN